MSEPHPPPERKTSLSCLVQATFGVAGLGVKDGASMPAVKEAGGAQPGRKLNFNAKTPAGSESSKHQAAVDKRDSSLSLTAVSPPPPGDASSLDYPVQRSISASGLIPRPPTGTEFSQGYKDSSAMATGVNMADVLRDLDAQAGEQQFRSRVMSVAGGKPLLSQPVSWEEDAVSPQHIWHEVDTREACHLAETQFCQEKKLTDPKRNKVKCSACKIMAHAVCIQQLYYNGYYCKHTYREIKQKVKDTIIHHHFLHRRKALGKCKRCDRSWANWKFNYGRDIIGFSCSWCGDSYHEACFREVGDSLKRESCHLGPLRNMIIPPSWIVKVPPLEQPPMLEAASPKTSRRRTRRSRKRRHDERASKHFTVKCPTSQSQRPLLVFINPKSGGNQGAKLLQVFQWLLNPRQVFDLSQGGPKFGLKFYQGVANLRILACGGDGTAGWVLSVLDELDIRPQPPVAVLPLGTGNDLARVIQWGGGYSDEPLDKILMHVEEGPVLKLDRWHLQVWPNPHAHESEGVDDVPLHVINNYFSIGADAHTALEFHLNREANPEKFNNRIKNKFFYTKLGGKDLVIRRFANLTEHIKLFGDGDDLTPRIRQLRLEAICLLNIPSYGAGSNPWGNPSSRDGRIGPQLMDDGRIEVVGFWSSTFPKLMVGLAHGERIAQCSHVKLITERSYPVQIDGEACKLQPSVIEVGLKNQALMVRKVARRNVTTPLQGVRPSDRIKLSVSKVTDEQYSHLHSSLDEIRRTATPLGIVTCTLQQTLLALRPQISFWTSHHDVSGQQLAPDWRFLDVATSGRVERMFQVLPDQEAAMFIEDMQSDGILVVELPASAPETPSILLSPAIEQERSLGDPDAASKRKNFGRNASYEIATGGSETLLSPNGASPPALGSVPEVSSSSSLTPEDSSPSVTPVMSDDDTCLLLPTVRDVVLESSELESASPKKALFDAVKRGNLHKVKEAHKRGCALTVADSNGWTPLHYAARHGRMDIVKYLTDNIPREAVDIVEEEKLQTPLHKAAWFGYYNVCVTLVEKGASLSRTDYQGNTPYLKSLQSGEKELQRFLKKKESEMRWEIEEAEMQI